MREARSFFNETQIKRMVYRLGKPYESCVNSAQILCRLQARTEDKQVKKDTRFKVGNMKEVWSKQEKETMLGALDIASQTLDEWQQGPIQDLTNEFQNVQTKFDQFRSFHVLRKYTRPPGYGRECRMG
jgi:hypothetical protein